MPKKKQNDNPDSHVKYTKFGYPYIDVDEFLASDKGKALDKRMEMVSDILKDKSRLSNTEREE